MAMGVAVKDVNSKAELEAAVANGRAVFLHFWATWCEPSKHMDVVFAQLAVDFPHATFFRVEAEQTPDITDAFEVSNVPFFLFFKDGGVIDKLEGANAPDLASKVSKLAGPVPPSATPAVAQSLGLSGHPVVPEPAQQVHSTIGNGNDGGGTTEVSETVKEGNPNEESNLNQRLKELINSKPVMLFMKGSADEPRCGFSKKVVNALNETGAEYGTFNILSDEGVRQGLKVFSNWPTYPQLYLKGELLGGCDIVLEMSKSGELKQTFDDAGLLPKPTLDERLKQLINSSQTMLFMKGTPDEPRCGFSRKVVNALKETEVEFGSFNILSDEEVRQGLKTYSNWPTFPQLYHKGELLGGCDIVLEMKASGELKETLQT